MNRIPRFTRLVAALGLGLSLATTLLASRPAQAEGEIRIAEQFGIVYLLLNVVRDQRLIEKHGQAEGLQIKVDWTQLSGGAAVNDALLSGAIDIAGAGVGPLLTIWDRTRGRQNVKAVASLGNFPYYLLSNDPRVRSIADFGAGDRIAVPAVGVSVQSRFLQYAAAKQWGDKQFDRLDKYTVALPHPDATAALVAGGTELTSAALLAPMIGKSTAAAAIVIWRAVTFYFYLVAGGPVFAVLAGRPLLKKLISSREASS